MAKQRIQVSIHPDLVAAAERLMGERSFASFSAYLETLIREEKERRAQGAADAAPAAVPVPARQLRKRRLKSLPAVPPQVALKKVLPPRVAAANE
jgi:metal-responsive CopG/Arc/MetJ family transcriptional regulator